MIKLREGILDSLLVLLNVANDVVYQLHKELITDALLLISVMHDADQVHKLEVLSSLQLTQGLVNFLHDAFL